MWIWCGIYRKNFKRRDFFTNHTFKVQWEEKTNSSALPCRKSTQVQATSMMEAKAKVRSRINIGVKVSNMVAFKVR